MTDDRRAKRVLDPTKSCTIRPKLEGWGRRWLAWKRGARSSREMEPLRELRELVERHVAPGPFATVENPELGLRLVVARRGQAEPTHAVYGRVAGVIVQGEK